MPVNPPALSFVSIPIARALHLACRRRTRLAIAADLAVSESTVKRWFRDLEALTGCSSGGELCDWWEEHEDDWLRHVFSAIGRPYNGETQTG